MVIHCAIKTRCTWPSPGISVRVLRHVFTFFLTREVSLRALSNRTIKIREITLDKSCLFFSLALKWTSEFEWVEISSRGFEERSISRGVDKKKKKRRNPIFSKENSRCSQGYSVHNFSSTEFSTSFSPDTSVSSKFVKGGGMGSFVFHVNHGQNRDRARWQETRREIGSCESKIGHLFLLFLSSAKIANSPNFPSSLLYFCSIFKLITPFLFLFIPVRNRKIREEIRISNTVFVCLVTSTLR